VMVLIAWRERRSANSRRRRRGTSLFQIAGRRWNRHEPFRCHMGQTPKLDIAPSSSSERNPAFAASPSRFTSNNTARVSPTSWPVGLSPLPVRGYRPNGSGRSPHDRSNLSPLQAPDKIPLDRLPPQPFDFGKRLIGGGSHRGSSILLLFLRESGRAPPILSPRRGQTPSTVQIAKIHAESARKRTDYSHRLNHWKYCTETAGQMSARIPGPTPIGERAG
jgi:hypothetical protein